MGGRHHGFIIRYRVPKSIAAAWPISDIHLSPSQRPDHGAQDDDLTTLLLHSTALYWNLHGSISGSCSTDGVFEFDFFSHSGSGVPLLGALSFDSEPLIFARYPTLALGRCIKNMYSITFAWEAPEEAERVRIDLDGL
jgi:hypothetical protein